MPLITCPVCDETDIDGVENLGDGRLVVRCLDCDHEWIRGEARAVITPRPPATYEQLHAAFPTAAKVTDEAMARVRKMTEQFLSSRPTIDPDVAPYWAKYQEIFSADGLGRAAPTELKAFANNSIGAHPGNMSVFNRAWNEMGDEKAAEQLRKTIGYLLRGPANTRLEDRFTELVEGRNNRGMTGFKESLLTRVLCIVEPGRFLPILRYSTVGGGKKEVSYAVYQLTLPQREKVSWTIGRLMTWSNDLLVDLLRGDFTELQHASQFLWWAKDQSLTMSPERSSTGLGI